MQCYFRIIVFCKVVFSAVRINITQIQLLRDLNGGRSREQTEQIESGGGQRSCKRWADRQKGNLFPFRLSAQGL